MKRRQFIARLGQTALAVSAFSAQRALGANNRVNVALIGCGGRGRLVARLMREVPGVDFVAVCDVYDVNAASAKEWAGSQCQSFRDFRRVLDMKDVDAVLIGTPDHWHAIPTVLACQAGKDVYVEKPLGHNIREGQKVVQAARRYNRVVQVGTQQRSAPHYAEAARIVASGELGPIHFIRIWNYMNMAPDGIGRAANSEPPSEVDWDMYLGPAPKVPFNRNRFVGTYRWFWDYAGGMVTDFGVHRFDSMHQVMGVKAPRTITASGGRYHLKDGGETPDTVQVTYNYGDFILSYEASTLNGHGAGGRTPDRRYYQARGSDDRPHGEAYYGTNGTMIVDRLGFEIYPELKGRRNPDSDSTLPAFRMQRKEMHAEDATARHAKNFIESVRSRKQPAAPADVGHHSSNVAHLGNIAYRTGRKIRWDAEKERIIGDDDAAKLLGRAARKPWDII